MHKVTDYDDSLKESEEKLVPKIAITYGVLRRLGFPDDVAERCLRSMPGIELSDAFDWVPYHFSFSYIVLLRSSLVAVHSLRRNEFASEYMQVSHFICKWPF